MLDGDPKKKRNGVTKQCCASWLFWCSGCWVSIAFILMIGGSVAFKQLMITGLVINGPTDERWDDFVKAGGGDDEGMKYKCKLYNITNEEAILNGAQPEVKTLEWYAVDTFGQRYNVTFDKGIVSFVIRGWVKELKDESTRDFEEPIVSINTAYLAALNQLKTFTGKDEEILRAMFAGMALGGLTAPPLSLNAMQWGSNAVVGAQTGQSGQGLDNRCTGSSFYDLYSMYVLGMPEFSCYTSRTPGAFLSKFDDTKAAEMWAILMNPTPMGGMLPLSAGQGSMMQITDLATALSAFKPLVAAAYQPVFDAIAADDMTLAASALDTAETSLASANAECQGHSWKFGSLTCAQLFDMSDYITHMATEFVFKPQILNAGGGVFMHATARQFICNGFTDPLMQLFTAAGLPGMPPQPGQAYLANFTKQFWEENLWKTLKPSGYDLGIDDINKVMSIHSLNGGMTSHDIWGPEVEIAGSLGGNFPPALELYPDTSTMYKEIAMWHDTAARPMFLEYTRDTFDRATRKVVLRRFELDASEKGLVAYKGQCGSDKGVPECLRDITAKMAGAPMLAGAPDYFGCTDEWIKENGAKGVTLPSKKRCDTFIEVEPVTGRAIEVSVKTALYCKIEPTAVWFPNIGNAGKPWYVPLAWLEISASVTEDQITMLSMLLEMARFLAYILPVLLIATSTVMTCSGCYLRWSYKTLASARIGHLDSTAKSGTGGSLSKSSMKYTPAAK